MNFRLSGQKINTSKSTKYLGIILEHLIFDKQLEAVKNKLNRANGILAKLRHFTSKDILRTNYFVIFDSHMRYACQVWGTNETQMMNSLKSSQNKVVRKINFKHYREPCEPLNKESKIYKLS